jgi:hypothetical protein
MPETLKKLSRYLIPFILLSSIVTPNANAIIITYMGDKYDVTTLTTSFDADHSLLSSQVWYLDFTAATAFATLVNTQLGTQSTVFGDLSPLFLFHTSITGYHTMAAWDANSNSVFIHDVNDGTSYIYAVAERVQVPEPSILSLLSLGLGVFLFARRKTTALFNS